MSKINSEVVADIQRLLNRDHGFDLTVDGDFGSPTFWDNAKTTNAILATLEKIGGPLSPKPHVPPEVVGNLTKVFLEVGHGQRPTGYDPGAVRSPSGPTEHKLNLVVAKAMKKRLVELGFDCKIGDTNASNYASGQEAKGYDLAVSIHHNAHTDGSKAQGAEAIFDPRSRNPKRDRRLCETLSAEMAAANGITNRGAKEMRLGVLSGFRSVGVPYSALIETYFIQRRPDANPATRDMKCWSRRAGVAAAEGVATFMKTL